MKLIYLPGIMMIFDKKMSNLKTFEDIKNISIPLISDEVLKREIKIVLKLMQKAISDIEINYENNVIDPFITLFEKIIFDIDDNAKWKNSEFQRQLQKTLGNHVGRFHQNLLCSLKDCEEPKEGGVDLISKKNKLFAEIKNKWNSTNADSKAGSYDKLSKALSKQKKYKAYFVTVIPKNYKNYCRTMITTSNKSKSQWRKQRKDIMEINAEFFYEIITKKKSVLKSIFYRIPDLAKSISNDNSELIDKIKNDKLFDYFLLEALGKNK